MSDTIPPHQLFHGTIAGRHLDLMRDVRNHVAEKTERPLHILSFGCSTGEECVDIASVFPLAQVYGLEIIPEVLTQARRFEGPQIHILESTESHLELGAPYDAAFAMNVLCVSPQTIGLDNISALYPFQRFDECIKLLDKNLAIGGVLTLYNAQYFLEDTQAGSHYEPLPHPSYRGSGWIEKCAPSGDRVAMTSFIHEGIDYSWQDWDQFVAITPAAQGPKHGRYRQDWIKNHARTDRRLDAAVWRKVS